MQFDIISNIYLISLLCLSFSLSYYISDKKYLLIINIL